jgi:ATP-binding cassette subfamily B protein
MKSKPGLLWHTMAGSRNLYFRAIIAMGIATLFYLTGPLVTRLAIDSVIGDKPMDYLPERAAQWIASFGGRDVLVHKIWLLGLVLVAVSVVGRTSLFFKGKWSAVASETIARNMRDRLYDHLQHLPYDYHVKAQTGDIIQRCTSDVETVRKFLALQFVEVGRALFMLAIAVPVMFSLNVEMTIITLSIIVPLFFFALVFFVKIKRAFKLSDEAEGALTTVVQENLTGIRVVRAFARQDYEKGKFEKVNASYRDLTYKLIKNLGWYWSISDFFSLTQIGLVILVGAFYASRGELTLGTFVVFHSYTWMILWPVRQMGRILTDMGKTFVSLERIQEILDAPRESASGKRIKPEIKGEIEFKHVSFAYEREDKVLQDISFRIPRGRTMAILGATGSGKSSLVHLLPALYDYKEGSIRIDNTELRDIDRTWLRNHVGIVLQEPFLFSKTVKENISLARPGAKETEIFEAAREAAIHNVIEDFDKGYETPVGEKGVTLSGGQKQRLAISRTLLKNPPILIFDDSLSSVDTQTDADIRKALQQRNRDATTIIISHRINTVSSADFILVLDKGRIIQQGTHRSLISKPGLYRRIWRMQNALEEKVSS